MRAKKHQSRKKCRFLDYGNETIKNFILSFEQIKIQPYVKLSLRKPDKRAYPIFIYFKTKVYICLQISSTLELTKTILVLGRSKPFYNTLK